MSIAVLLVSVAFWGSMARYEVAVNLVVSLAASVVAYQAVHAGKRSWAGGFAAIALLFNPMVPVIGLAGGLSMSLVVASIAAFVVSLGALRPQRRLSIPSITDRNPGSESL
jgi:hypothetical protein